jgi:hypothetical protein
MTTEPTLNFNDHRDRLMDYIYQELTPAETRAFEQHLEGCQRCQRDLADFHQVRSALASWELEGVPHISVTVDPPATKRWLELFRALPFWLRLATTAAAVMLLLALFNVRVSYQATDGFQFSASLMPPSLGNAPRANEPRPVGLSEPQVRALIETAIIQANQQRDQQVTAQLEALAKDMRSENQQKLIKLAQALRQEQEDRFLEVWDQAQRSSYTTLTELLYGGNNNGY